MKNGDKVVFTKATIARANEHEAKKIDKYLKKGELMLDKVYTVFSVISGVHTFIELDGIPKVKWDTRCCRLYVSGEFKEKRRQETMEKKTGHNGKTPFKFSDQQIIDVYESLEKTGELKTKIIAEIVGLSFQTYQNRKGKLINAVHGLAKSQGKELVTKRGWWLLKDDVEDETVETVPDESFNPNVDLVNKNKILEDRVKQMDKEAAETEKVIEILETKLKSAEQNVGILDAENTAKDDKIREFQESVNILQNNNDLLRRTNEVQSQELEQVRNDNRFYVSLMEEKDKEIGESKDLTTKCIAIAYNLSKGL